MQSFKQRALDFIDVEWATYVDRFQRWPREYGAQRVQEQGYARFGDLLAHVLAWWEEAIPIILAIANDRAYERKKYDFDEFNAAAVEKYKTLNETQLIQRFEETRQKAGVDLRSVQDAAWENRRLHSWADGVIISHAREHVVSLSPFLALDTLENEWSEYVARYHRLEDKPDFLMKQGFASLHDLLAHVIGWWDEGDRIIRGLLRDPKFASDDHDADAYNAQLIAKYEHVSDAEVHLEFEEKRKRYVTLLNELPVDALSNREIENWLAADVVEHFDEHAIGAQ